MQPTRKLLAPIDLSRNAEAAVENAIRFAETLDAELMLLHVVDQHELRTARRLMWPTNALGRAKTKYDIHRLLLPGDVVETISRYADFVDAGLIVMAGEYRKKWSRLWKRSVTDAVMESTLRPVCATDLPSVKTSDRFDCCKILCLTMLDGQDDAVLLQAEALARRSGGEVILLGVVPEINEGLLLQAAAGFDRPLSTDLALERIRELGESLTVPYRTSVVVGSPYRCLAAAAREHAADVVVVERAAPGRAQSGRTQSCRLDMPSVLPRLLCPLVSVTEGWPAIRLAEDAVEDEIALPVNAAYSSTERSAGRKGAAVGVRAQ